ncbi:MAG TPA: hypothetical protein VIJ90_03385 [Gemmatimonadaceae bacterium]
MPVVLRKASGEGVVRLASADHHFNALAFALPLDALTGVGEILN